MVRFRRGAAAGFGVFSFFSPMNKSLMVRPRVLTISVVAQPAKHFKRTLSSFKEIERLCPPGCWPSLWAGQQAIHLLLPAGLTFFKRARIVSTDFISFLTVQVQGL